MVEPQNETHWRNSVHAERLAGDRAGIERMVVQFELAMKQMGLRTEDLEPATREHRDGDHSAPNAALRPRR